MNFDKEAQAKIDSLRAERDSERAEKEGYIVLADLYLEQLHEAEEREKALLGQLRLKHIENTYEVA